MLEVYLNLDRYRVIRRSLESEQKELYLRLTPTERFLVEKLAECDNMPLNRKPRERKARIEKEAASFVNNFTTPVKKAPEVEKEVVEPVVVEVPVVANI